MTVDFKQMRVPKPEIGYTILSFMQIISRQIIWMGIGLRVFHVDGNLLGQCFAQTGFARTYFGKAKQF